MLTHLIQSFGYLAVFVLMTLESALLPIPSEVTMPFAGYLASRGALNLWAVIVLGAIGNLIGSLAAYYFGYLIEEHLLVEWIRRYGKYLLIRESDYHRGASWFSRYGTAAVFFSRLLPAVRTYISLPAGMFEMNLWRFSAYTLIGSLLWSGFLAWVGYTLGTHWGDIGNVLRPLEYIVVASIVLFIGYGVYRITRRYNRSL
ncbi:MAG: DedA family protein [Patescibacteria group bacterium]|nr:DedA family protein [Patescibacteria group bacterium]MDE1945137.1 DedA family protein [Patescibacteria group bacterium]MDE2057672.1 DedA family protein [Patescibacteria group bacterium]